MVCIPRHLFAAVVAIAALQLHQVTASSLQTDPTTTCTSYNISDKNFPGRGSEIEDDGTCVVTVPGGPSGPKAAGISPVPVTQPNLLSKMSTAPVDPVFTKVGTEIMSEKIPADGADHDAYVVSPVSIPTITTNSGSPRRRLESTNDDLEFLAGYLKVTMETKLKNLPTTAVYKHSPWAGSNWPTYLDSINYNWNKDQLSPAEKYATAFGLNVTKFMDNVSAQNGINANMNRTECTTNQECFDPNVDTVCGKRVGNDSGYCIPTWFGICNAWAPAAILEQEPNCPVTYNGVTFQPMDIKALVTDIYDDANLTGVFTGARYYGTDDSINEYGSHTDNSYRDLNPGYFHIAAANLLGLLNTTFIIDRDAGVEVWNQPVVGFKVYEQTAMTTTEAAQTFYGLESYPWNDNATSIVYVKSRLSWINETFTDGGLIASGRNQNFTVGSYYDYLLELDDAEEIIGGEWLYDSNTNHPDFLWL
ncbi:Transglutaminase elicitor, partial [Phytophthora megakarya]